MSVEEGIKKELADKFSFLEKKIIIARVRRVSAEVEQKHFIDVLKFVIQQMKFSHLITITGLDEQANLSFIYHLSNENGVVLNLKTSVPKDNPVMGSVIEYFSSAEAYERELVDLFGAKIEGLPKGSRYPLTDDWPKDQFPLRKDWKNG